MWLLRYWKWKCRDRLSNQHLQKLMYRRERLCRHVWTYSDVYFITGSCFSYLLSKDVLQEQWVMTSTFICSPKRKIEKSYKTSLCETEIYSEVFCGRSSDFIISCALIVFLKLLKEDQAHSITDPPLYLMVKMPKPPWRICSRKSCSLNSLFQTWDVRRFICADAYILLVL